MSEPRATSQDDEHTPPLAQELVRFTWKMGDAGSGSAPAPAPVSKTAEEREEISEVDALRAQVRYFTGALEDIVTLALSNADYKERAIMMHRRAVAALSSAGGRPIPANPK